jgi:hypothetical protein
MTKEKVAGWHECERCSQNFPAMSLFTCKGRTVCEGCYMTETKGNTIFFDESKYQRTRDSEGNPITRQERIKMFGREAVDAFDHAEEIKERQKRMTEPQQTFKF